MHNQFIMKVLPIISQRSYQTIKFRYKKTLLGLYQQGFFGKIVRLLFTTSTITLAILNSPLSIHPRL